MPAPIDLTGRRFGKLLVLSRAEDHVSSSGKSHTPAWLCLCDCGQQEAIVARRLPYVQSNIDRRDVAYQCSECTYRRVCVVCGDEFASQKYSVCCSPKCRRLHSNAIAQKHWLATAASDPMRIAAYRQSARSRYALDPALGKKIVELRKKRLAEMTPEGRASWLAQTREHMRESRRRIALRKLMAAGQELQKRSGES